MIYASKQFACVQDTGTQTGASDKQTRRNVCNAKFVPFWNVTDGMQHFAVLFLIAVVDLSLAGQEMRLRSLARSRTFQD